MKHFFKSIKRLPLLVRIISMLFIIHLFIYKSILIDINFFSNKLIEIGELFIDFEIAFLTSLIFYLVIDSRLELEKEKIYNRSIHLISSLFYAYFSFTDISFKLLNKCRNKELFISEEFSIYDLKGNSLFEISQTNDTIQIIPNKKNFNKLIKHQEELNFLISILDYETYLLVSNFKENVLELKFALKRYNEPNNEKNFNLVNDVILKMINSYIQLISNNDYSQKKLKEISIIN